MHVADVGVGATTSKSIVGQHSRLRTARYSNTGLARATRQAEPGAVRSQALAAATRDVRDRRPSQWDAVLRPVPAAISSWPLSDDGLRSTDQLRAASADGSGSTLLSLTSRLHQCSASAKRQSPASRPNHFVVNFRRPAQRIRTTPASPRMSRKPIVPPPPPCPALVCATTSMDTVAALEVVPRLSCTVY